ncbi:hypothetical protein OHS33_17750 [Streptomyces sp. NBC_00536]|uniref:hypothetical protein n=1 Tax=Streptomyces sp. NBC_00536 TaxID=2975769 RepID=UPI002E8001BB|nr:hypothetical protein [Streptomyces sp. NBC_00536]WUC80027.1 hypothetical protein OHS33_17750 [Streptomyces sp. NBC_00536]
MSFDQEWAEVRASVADKQTGMRLNHVPAEDGGGPTPQGDLVVTQQDLAAVGDAAFKLHQRLNTDGDHAKASTYEAAGSLKQGFALGGALSTVADKWNTQVNTLLEACAHISNHLDYTQNAHAEGEYWIATQLKYEQLDKGFEERAQH